MRITRGIAALLLLLVVLAGVSACGSKSAVEAVVRVNGEDITRTEFERLYEQILNQTGVTPDATQTVEYRKAVLEMLIDSTLIRQEATRLGADLSDEAVNKQVQSYVASSGGQEQFDATLAQMGMTLDDLKRGIRDQLAQQFLSEYASKETSVTTLPETYVLLEHILVAASDEETATKLYDEIQKGADFATLAKENSIDPGSGSQGGLLGWSPTRAYVPEFKAAADALAVGEVSEPVLSEFGWHIIRKVDEAKAGSAIADLPEELQQQLAQSDLPLDAYVARLREQAKIEYLDETLKPS